MAETVADSSPEASGQEEQVKASWQVYLEKAQSFIQDNRGYQAIMMVMLAAGIALLVVFWLWSQSADYQPLYGNQELYDVASIVEVLDREGMEYKLHPESGQVLVDAGRLSEARMKLSVAGIQARSPEGLDSLNQQELGTSQFVEGVRYLRGLEGELAQTIISLKPVKNARIHLAIPKRSSFIRRQEKPSASVFVSLYAGYRLNSEQIEGIINLVATSVANMNREDVSVIDQSGKLLSSEVLLNDSALGEVSRQFDFKQQVESRYQERISHLLEPLVGPGNYRAQVTASVDFEKVIQTVEQFDPGTAVLRSEQGKERINTGGQARGIPGTLSNQPPEETDPEDDTETSTQSEFVRNYEVDKVVRQVSNQQGRIEKLSIAVVFNEKPDQALGTVSWDQARLDSIRQLIIDATGLDQARGDQISIHTAPFVPVASVAPEPLVWWQQPQALYYVKYGSGTLLAVMVLMFLIRPLMKQVTVNLEPPKESLPALVEGGALDSQEGEENERRILFDETFNLLPPELADFETQITHMRKLSTKQPERVAQVIKLWMSSYD
ncbi:flagellar M-ring protein FliF [Thalassotalea sp. G20_0]|uniref:flagellar basal-body MS-ring/collar protein FliF n=1 Tax=Thalassotalea sp. G20_0 TaxID=2821093 RepID=UPI001ADA8C8C|nr:flagellar basal-body MS-ring/collar protein FliF [Thalassotalea sp. G20_0]MBO9495238.1 flagellar M-ring protein FliF [Thalassotalea sp. G20_0]